MNAYLVQEDVDSKVWLGETMQAALNDAWTDHLRELQEAGVAPDEHDERAYYEETILKSCTFLGEVGEVRPTPQEIELREGIAEIDMGDED